MAKRKTEIESDSVENATHLSSPRKKHKSKSKKIENQDDDDKTHRDSLVKMANRKTEIESDSVETATHLSSPRKKHKSKSKKIENQDGDDKTHRGSSQTNSKSKDINGDGQTDRGKSKEVSYDEDMLELDLLFEERSANEDELLGEHQEEALDENDPDNSSTQHSLDGAVTWSRESEIRLIDRIQSALPDRRMSYRAAGELAWDEIAFDDFSADQVKKKWDSLSKPIPKLRTFIEVLQEAKENTEKKKSPQKHQKVKRPKYPTSVFYRYIQDHWESYAEKHPDKCRQDVLKKLTKKFNKLSDEKKSKYNEAYESEMAEYRQQLAKFTSEVPSKRKVSCGKIPQNYYIDQKVATKQRKGSTDKLVELRKKYSQKWKSLKDKRKYKYIKMAEEDHQKYLEEARLNSDPDLKCQVPVNFCSKQELKILHEIEGRSKPQEERRKNPAFGGFNLFVKELLYENDNVKLQNKNRVASLIWHSMDAKDKQQFKDRAAGKSDTNPKTGETP